MDETNKKMENRKIIAIQKINSPVLPQLNDHHVHLMFAHVDPLHILLFPQMFQTS